MTQDRQYNRHQLGQLIGANKRDHYYELHYSSGEVARLYILADGIFRYFLDPSKKFNENHNPLVDLAQFSNHAFAASQPRATSDSLIIKSGSYQLIFQQKPAILRIFDENLHRMRLSQLSPSELAPQQTTEILQQHQHEFYFGCGLQNGHFSHKGRVIQIHCDHLTGQDGVLSQVPFFWSNAGFGELRNTTTTGTYDFGQRQPEATVLTHQTPLLDVFYLLGNSPQAIISKYYRLTGKPLMPPKYLLSLGHIGNFLTTLWRPSQAKQRNAQMFENDQYYVRTNEEKEASGKASLNGEEEYQFSARAMIDRYQKHHFALGWFLPNFGAALPNSQRLATFNDYASTHGVASGLWTTSVPDLPQNTSFIMTAAKRELLQQDQQKLQANLNRRRPLLFADSGFAGSQKQAALIFGTPGGNWTSLKTQIAGLLGANLSGQPLTGASIDGTAGGGNAQIALRDLEWKIFTPLLFYWDDQGNFSKTPFAYNSKVTRINQAYMSLRRQLRTYLYTLLYSAEQGNPIMQALFIEFPHEQINYTEQVKEEFMLGPNLLIAPITNGKEDSAGNSRKDGLYLPSHHTMWLDLFTGHKYLGGRVYNHLSYPAWHLPVFVRGGAIFDLGQRNFVLYPQNHSQAVFYNDDGFTDFQHQHSQTKISSNLQSSRLRIVIDPVQGSFSSMKKEASTALNIICDAYPDQITVKINDQEVKLQEYGSKETFAHAKEGFFYNPHYSFLPAFAYYQKPEQAALQIKLAARDITASKFEIIVQNFSFGRATLVHAITDSVLHSPKAVIDRDQITAHSFTVSWPQLTETVQIELNGILNDGITGSSFTFHELKPHTRYLLRLRYVAGSKVSEWSDPLYAMTKRAAIDYAVKDIATTANYQAAPRHPLTYLTDLKAASEWQSVPFDPSRPLTLTFTFPEKEDLSRMAFVPREVDHRGTPTEVSLAIAEDGQHFAPYGQHVTWKADSKNKVIGLRNVRAKAIRLTVYHSSGPIVAAREVIFFKNRNAGKD